MSRLDLRTLKRDASVAYYTAQKAEYQYRTRRQAKAAREEGRAAKLHLGNSWREGKQGVSLNHPYSSAFECSVECSLTYDVGESELQSY